MNLHACAIVLKTFGILIIGNSQSGKSTLARKLINYGKQQNYFSCWIGDDQIKIKQFHNKCIASPMLAGKAETFGFGIKKIDYIKHAIIDLAVELKPIDKIERMPEKQLLSQLPPLPQIQIPLIQVPQKNSTIAIEIILAYLLAKQTKI